MPYFENEGVQVHYEVAGEGAPIVFAHEFAGDSSSWEPQVRYFSRRYRCITYNARGYPPSDVPENSDAYSQANAVADLVALLDHLGIQATNVVGLSMGSFTALHFGLTHPARALSLVVAGSAYGSVGEGRENFVEAIGGLADGLAADGMNCALALNYLDGAARLTFKAKDPLGYEEFKTNFLSHSGMGSAHILRGVQLSRPQFSEIEDGLRAMEVPVLLVAGDADAPSLPGALELLEMLPRAALWVVPRTGHTINLEEPMAFNRNVEDFVAQVASDRW
jgi:pimeloyl-ACP methyl ester carboxylesterase